MACFSQFVFIFVICIAALAQNESQSRVASDDQEHTAWIANALHTIETIKPGMARSDLTRLFTTEGGLSTTSQATYVYRQCPYIKVDVKFSASGKEELPTDKIVEVSRPYLAWRISD